MAEDTFRWVIAGGVAISTLCIIVTVVIAYSIYRAVLDVRDQAEGTLDRVGPVVSKASFVLDEIKPVAISLKKLADENGPKLSAVATRAVQIADNAKDVSDVVRDQAHRFAEVGRDFADVGRDIAERATAQVAKVDAVVEDTVDQVHHVGANLKDAALKPVREASGVIAGVRAAVSSYAQGRRTGVGRITQDEEMFI
jgi:methyl-accepting chemotaxis protein